MEWQVIPVRTGRRVELVEVTREIDRVVSESPVEDGVCFLFVPHTTAGVLINENADPSVARDLMATLDGLVPERGDYQHAEGNSDAHVKSVLAGCSAIVPIGEGRLALGTWQGIFFAEFDGPRSRRLLVKPAAL